MIAAKSTPTTGAGARAGRLAAECQRRPVRLRAAGARCPPAARRRDGRLGGLRLDRAAPAPPTAARALRANAALAGPAKWVAGATARCGAAPTCRGVDFGWQAMRGRFRHTRRTRPATGLGRRVTALATGQPPAAAVAVLDLDAACDLLKRSGRSASIDEGLLRVHVQLPDLYREICVTHGGDSVSRIVAELIDLTDLTGPSRARGLRLCRRRQPATSPGAVVAAATKRLAAAVGRSGLSRLRVRHSGRLDRHGGRSGRSRHRIVCARVGSAGRSGARRTCPGRHGGQKPSKGVVR